MDRAYQRHIANESCWSANIDKFQTMRLNRHKKDVKLNSPRTLIEMQKYFEDSFLNDEEKNDLKETRDYSKLSNHDQENLKNSIL